jgi:hypothetical protein
MIDEGKGPEVFQPHLAVVVRSTEDDRHVGIEILDKFRHRQAGDVLIERGGKTDNLILPPVDGGQSPGQELWCRPRRHVFEERGRMPALLGDLFKHRLKQAGILSAFRIVAKQEICKNPFAKQRPFFADRFIEGHADLVSKTDVQMVAVDGDPPRLEQRGECAQLDRRVLRVAERHSDERHLSLVAHLLPRGFMTQPSDPQLTGSRAKRFKLAIGFGGHVKVALRQAIDLVRPDLDLALAPGKIEIGMVAFRFCHGTHLVHIGQGLGEILERIQALKMAGLVQRPPAAEFL